MRVRRIDGTGDWTFGKGKNSYLKDNDATAQNIKTRLNSFLGDCFFDLTAGIDWFSRLGSKELVQLRLEISTMILNTPDVTGLTLLNTNLDAKTRELTVTYVVQTVYSTITDSFQSTVNNLG